MNRLTQTLFALPYILLALAAGPGQAQEFLDPEVAFKFSARALDAQTIEANWKIADGYYLYKDKFKFALSGAKLGAAQYPAGKIKDDPTFGTVEIYKKSVSIRLPVVREPGTALPVKLEATFQGCAEDGVCYMPVTSTASLRLAALDAPKTGTAPQQSAAPASALASLRNLAGNDGTADLLPPDEAFKAEASLKDAQTLAVSYAIAKDYYLYRDKLKFVVKSPEGVATGKIATPAPDVKDDPTFGRTEVYHKDFTAEVALSRPLKEGEELAVEVHYQGCSELGVCYPPTAKAFTLAFAGNGAPAAATSLPSDEGADGGVDANDTGSIEKTLNKGGLWVAVVAFFGFGLALSLTPCVFPMIPILSGIIAGQKHVTHASGFFLSLAYVLGMAITYAVIGVIAAQSGTLLSNALQNPVALGIGAAIFVALALSMFGFYDLQLPNALQSKLSETSN
jgi:thiol:disulfide interchange protein DsbD